jgi:hypothetical protein
MAKKAMPAGGTRRTQVAHRAYIGGEAGAEQGRGNTACGRKRSAERKLLRLADGGRSSKYMPAVFVILIDVML